MLTVKRPRIIKWISRVSDYITLIFHEDSVQPWSVIRHSIGILLCYKFYGASIADYFELRLFEKTHAERKTFFTAYQAQRFISRINGPENNLLFADKINMYCLLGSFIRREQLVCPPENYKVFEAFMKRHRMLFYKASNAYCGSGIELWDIDHSDIQKLYERSLEQPAVLDELVVQHPELARLNPDSINTVKLYTLMCGNRCIFVAAEFRMGRCGSFVDNIERGGIAANIDIKTGAVIGDAYDLQMNQYQAHPDTGVKITGFKLPNWDEILRFTEECARACDLAYVEWDLAIRERDCVLIEANPNARNCGIQMGAFPVRKKQFQELERLYTESLS